MDPGALTFWRLADYRETNNNTSLEVSDTVHLFSMDERKTK
jgi:hypothetical protein